MDHVPDNRNITVHKQWALPQSSPNVPQLPFIWTSKHCPVCNQGILKVHHAMCISGYLLEPKQKDSRNETWDVKVTQRGCISDVGIDTRDCWKPQNGMEYRL